MTGIAGGQAIATLITNFVDENEGFPLTHLNIRQNRLENAGSQLVFRALANYKCAVKKLSM